MCVCVCWHFRLDGSDQHCVIQAALWYSMHVPSLPTTWLKYALSVHKRMKTYSTIMVSTRISAGSTSCAPPHCSEAYIPDAMCPHNLYSTAYTWVVCVCVCVCVCAHAQSALQASVELSWKYQLHTYYGDKGKIQLSQISA